MPLAPASMPQPPGIPAAAPSAYQQGLALGRQLNALRRQAPSSPQGHAAASIHNPVEPGSELNPGQLKAIEQAAQATPNLKYLLRSEIDGNPVIPPGMTMQQASAYVSHQWMGEHMRKAKTFVFISMSMPAGDIQRILANIWNHKSLRDEAVVVLRGWEPEPTGLPELVNEVMHLQPSATQRVNVAVDPMLYESFHIHQVPVIERTDGKGGWRTLQGDGYLPSQAVALLDQGKDDGKVKGNLYPVREPDMIQVMQERMRAYDWKQHEQQANAAFFHAMPGHAADLPESPTGVLMFHDPAVVVTRDIRLPDGRLVARAGQRINPLDNPTMPWSTWRAVVFNASKPWEVRQALHWSQQYPSARLMMVAPPDTQAGYVAVEKLFGRPVFVASPLVVGRLGVPATPALVWADHSQLAIHVLPIPAFAKAAKSSQETPHAP